MLNSEETHDSSCEVPRGHPKGRPPETTSSRHTPRSHGYSLKTLFLAWHNAFGQILTKGFDIIWKCLGDISLVAAFAGQQAEKFVRITDKATKELIAFVGIHKATRIAARLGADLAAECETHGRKSNGADSSMSFKHHFNQAESFEKLAAEIN